MFANRIVMTQERFLRILQELNFMRYRYAQACGEECGPAGNDTLPPLSGPEADGINLRLLKEQIHAMEEKIRFAEVVPRSHRESVYFGSTVRVRDLDRDKEARFRLVGPEELDAEVGSISSASPIGKGLLGRKVGDIVTVSIPKGLLRLKILGFD